MRQIKFRGLDENGKWVYGHHATGEDGKHYIVDAIHHIGSSEWNVDCVVVGCVGQYINIDDKNDVEVYTGDIVVAKTVEHSLDGPCYVSGYLKGVVEYNSGTFCLLSDSGSYHPHWLYAGEIEVVGNIHQNPESIEDDC